MVKVKLVENNVKRKVGIVMVVKVMSQKRIPGMIFMSQRVILPKVPSQDREALTAGSRSVSAIAAVALAMAEDAVEFMV
jgi:hypothetical protein